jgi:hypothetical protein
MRLKSEVWVAALLRRCQAQGHYGAVVRRGAAEAGAVFIIVNHLDGTCDLLGPPPGPAYDDSGERRFAKEFINPVSLQEIEKHLHRKRKSDPDLWEVEIEDRKGLAGLTVEIM